MRVTVNGSYLSNLMPKNNIHGRVKELIDDSLLYNQLHVVNHLHKELVCLMRLGDTKKPRMDQVPYFFYKTDENME